MSDTATLKPGDTLTAAQANSLPVGSQVEDVDGDYFFERYPDGWGDRGDGHAWHDGKIYSNGHTLLRVGPAAFAVGDVVSREQLDALPTYSRVACGDGSVAEKLLADWVWRGVHAICPQPAPYTVSFLPSPANPHAPGSLAWARWAAEKEGACVQHLDDDSAWRFYGGKYEFYFCDGWHEFYFGDVWRTPHGFGDDKSDYNIEGCEPTGWAVVPDPSAGETPVETSDETPVLHIDPAAITAELDKAIPQWREEGFTVAQAIRVLRQRYEMQMQVCAYQGDSAAASAKHVARLEAERERLENLVAQYKQGEDDAADRINYETERREELKAERDRLRTENADLLATAEVLKRERDSSRLESMNYERECMKALEQRDAREAMLDRFVEALGGIEACGEHSSSNCPWHVALEEAESLTAERDAAIREIGKSCYSMTYEHAEQIKGITDERDTALQRAEKAEAAAKVVVPEDVRKAAFNLMYSMDNGKSAAGKFILSLTDHIASVGKMVQSAHPEGSREWAEDAMLQGFSVIYGDANFHWTNFQPSVKKGHQWYHMALTGWRIHTPAVAPSTEPSVAQLAASIEALNERILALEGKQS